MYAIVRYVLRQQHNHNHAGPASDSMVMVDRRTLFAIALTPFFGMHAHHYIITQHTRCMPQVLCDVNIHCIHNPTRTLQWHPP